MELNSPKIAKKYFQSEVKEKIIGIGVTAFNRVGLENIISQYEIFSLKKTYDDPAIREKIKLNILEELKEVDYQKSKKNSTTIIENPVFKKYLATQDQSAALLFYKISGKIEKICRENNWLMVANSVLYGKKSFEDKVFFRGVLKEADLEAIPGGVRNLSGLNYDDIKKDLGERFVVQLPHLGGGKGTFFINSKKDLENFYQKNVVKECPYSKVVVTKYISGPSPSIVGCVTRAGIMHAGLQYQVLSIPTLYDSSVGSGLFCGHDWSDLRFSKKAQKQAERMVQKLGRHLQKNKYKGIFGIDLIHDEETDTLYPVEVNPRLTGAYPVLNMIQESRGQVPLQSFHILEFLGKDYNVDIDKYNQQSFEKSSGAHLVFHNLDLQEKMITKDFSGGLHSQKGLSSLASEAYSLKSVENSDDFVIVDNILLSGGILKGHQRMFRTLHGKAVLSDDKKSLKPEILELTNALYQKASQALKPRN